MDEFIYKAPYEEEGKRILEVNILPETYCSFNCIYCPIDRKEDRIRRMKSRIWGT